MMSFNEIAKELGISPASAFFTYKKALRKLKAPKNKAKWEAIIETMGMIDEQRAKNLKEGEKT